MTIITDRLILRPWTPKDLEPFAKLNADPRVMEFFPSPLKKEESDLLGKLITQKIEENGWGCFAVSVIDGPEFIGFIGLKYWEKLSLDTPFTPAVEVGWRLAYDYWGKGYATEGAKASLLYGFETLKLNEIISFTTASNMRSRAVMERIGMYRDPKDDFAHPKLPVDHRLSKHVLYRTSA